MKIGIFTFFRDNYGAVLQAYALQRYLKNQYPDAQVQIVDFKTEYHEKITKVFKRRSPNFLKNVVWRFLTIIRFRQLKERRIQFDSFVSGEFDLTERYKTSESLLNNPPRMDIYISGSDQVFNPNSNYLKVYYLAFNKNKSKKIAYAPSFGIHKFDDSLKNSITSYLQDFDALSCREKDGADFIKTIVNKDIPVVLDPVFLLSKKQWENIAIKPKINQKYIFIYALKGQRELLQMANKIKKTTGYKIILLSPGGLRFYNCKQIFNVGPKEFIGLINSAEYVVTDSFHGTAFSVLLQKKFYVYISRPHVSSRIFNLLSSIGLNNQITEYNKYSKFKFDNTNLPPYALSLSEIRNESTQFLKESIAYQATL